MHYILAQLKNGNTSVLNRRPMMYGDFTDAPKSYAEALQLLIDGHAAFDALPLSVRNKFDNSFEKWFATVGTPDWLNAMTPEHLDSDSPSDSPSDPSSDPNS